MYDTTYVYYNLRVVCIYLKFDFIIHILGWVDFHLFSSKTLTSGWHLRGGPFLALCKNKQKNSPKNNFRAAIFAKRNRLHT